MSVRAAAAVLLDRLPNSRRAKRMAERVRALTKPDGTVELPGKPDATGRRDEIPTWEFLTTPQAALVKRARGLAAIFPGATARKSEAS